jgi:peptidoglycan/LPS O-acetylase OafA/YrhL
MKQEKNTIHFLNALRALAVMLVLLSHLRWWLNEYHQPSVTMDAFHFFMNDILHLYQDGGHLGVLIFFLVSGYIITHVSFRETPLAFFFKRLLRIWPMLIVAILLCAGVVAASAVIGLPEPLGIEGKSIWRYFNNMLLINPFTRTKIVLGVTWTLFIEVAFYWLTLVFMPVNRRNPLVATLGMILVIVAIGLLGWKFMRFRPFAMNSLPVFFILIGRCIYLARLRLSHWLPSIACALVCVGLYLLSQNIVSGGKYLAKGILVHTSNFGAIVIFMAGMAFFRRENWRITRFISDTSYSLYLLHMPIGMFLLNLFRFAGVPYVISAAVAISAVFIGSALTRKFVEVPFQNLARFLIERRAVGKL